jgi:hypothetical protein
MSAADDALEALPVQDCGDAKKVRFDFEPHYGLSHRSARDVLHEILEDLSSYKHIHNWEYKLITSPLTALAGVARSYLNENPPHLDSLLDDAVVDEVLIVGGINRRPSIKQETNAIDTHLFFTKVRGHF